MNTCFEIDIQQNILSSLSFFDYYLFFTLYMIIICLQIHLKHIVENASFRFFFPVVLYIYLSFKKKKKKKNNKKQANTNNVWKLKH